MSLQAAIAKLARVYIALRREINIQWLEHRFRKKQDSCVYICISEAKIHLDEVNGAYE